MYNKYMNCCCNSRLSKNQVLVVNHYYYNNCNESHYDTITRTTLIISNGLCKKWKH